jgi:hypothetical protein
MESAAAGTRGAGFGATLADRGDRVYLNGCRTRFGCGRENAREFYLVTADLFGGDFSFEHGANVGRAEDHRIAGAGLHASAEFGRLRCLLRTGGNYGGEREGEDAERAAEYEWSGFCASHSDLLSRVGHVC